MILSTTLKQALQLQHEMLNELTYGLTKEQLRKQPEPGKWSIHQQITHLAVYQPVFYGRMVKILNEDNPTFGRYLADNDPDFAAAEKESTDTLLTKLKKERHDLYVLITSLTHAQLGRTGTHPLFGKMTIPDWTHFFILHEAHHLFSIFKLCKTLR